ncbi:class I SAM-dependent methyltransferase [Aureisphaera sp. CAU 1614]|uniref:Class I SAM-dependent methyltransferase n=1 Tax=Halomarinibacterium sedimenti TaxID=2857106 RepID=A0A9X1FQW4_9FLAO|nr:class I SAM-dependent methyltransferase [Halomarinibacterium sedimenti]MBW2938895.1 class I SAM-dependent methyltransferase [Halomarinibacterium sedimenti]
MKDILGKALLDYFHGNYTEDILTETNISDEDELPLPYLFRNYDEMPSLEQKALELCKGTVLDVGCGAGSHSLWLQNKGLQVTAIDTSKGALEVTRLRGVENVKQISLLDYSEAKFDTILLLMNGTGIFETIDQVPNYLHHLKSLLQPNGQILIDSSDLKYMYDTSEEGGIWVPADRYYGELEFTMKYKGELSNPFHWLYLDSARFEVYAKNNGFKFETIIEGEHFEYLARLTAYPL